MSDGFQQTECQTGNDERGTPAHVIRLFQDAIGGLFDLDPAAGAEPIQIARERYTKAENGLARDWSGSAVWLNPPYSDPGPWLAKAVAEIDRRDDDAPELVLALVKGDVSTRWFQDYATQADYLGLVDGRLSFHGADGSAPFASIVAAFGDVTEDVLDALDRLGSVYSRETVSGAHSQSRLGDLLEDGGIAAATPGVAAPTPGGLQVSLDRLQPHESVTVEFGDGRHGAVRELPDAVTVDVLPDGTTFDTDRGEISVNCLGPNRLPDGRDLYLQLRESAYAATRVEVAVAVDGRYWELAPVERITRPTTASPGAEVVV